MSSELESRYGRDEWGAELVQAMATAITVRRLYPAEHPSCLRALERLVNALEPFYGDKGSACVESDEGKLLVNGEEAQGATDLTSWLSEQFRRRLIKGIVIDAQVEPTALVELSGLLGGRIQGMTLEDLRKRLEDASGEHVRVLESAYSRDVTDGSIDKVMAGHEWLLAMTHTAASLVLPPEAQALVHRLESMNEGENADEEVDMVAMIAQCAAERFGDAVPDDSHRMEILLTHVLGQLKHETEGEVQEPSTFQRRQLLGMLVQRILGRTPNLIGAIAESAGPLLGQIRARSVGRNPGEVLRHLFMRTLGKSTGDQPAGDQPETQTDDGASDAVDGAYLLTEFKRMGVNGGLPSRINRAEVARDFVVFLADWASSGMSERRRERARSRLREIVAEEIALPGRYPGQVLHILCGAEGGPLDLAMRKEIFRDVDCETFMGYLVRHVRTEAERAAGLRGAWEVLGEDVIEEIVRWTAQHRDDARSHELLKTAVGALTKEIAAFLMGLKGDSAAEGAGLAMEISERLDALEQTELLSALAMRLGDATPVGMGVRLARVSSASARRALREWLTSVSGKRRRAFAEKLLSADDAGTVEAASEIATGTGVWRKMYPERRAAIQALASAGGARARDALTTIARERWRFLSRERRSCARLAREALARLAVTDRQAPK